MRFILAIIALLFLGCASHPVYTVYTSSGYNGRGYDGTTAQAHAPNTSNAGVQTCWSASEAFEANAAAVGLLGGSARQACA